MTMSMQGVRWRDLALIAIYSTRHAIRSGSGLVFLLILVMFGLFAAHVLITPIEAIEQQQKKEGIVLERDDLVDRLVDLVRPVISWAVGGPSPMETDETGQSPASAPPSSETVEPTESERWTSFLLDDRPAVLSAILLIVVFGLPFVVSFGGFNLISGDVQSLGIRYQLLRVERSNIFFGRFLGSIVFTVLGLLLVMLIITLYMGFRLQIYSVGVLTVASLHGFLALVVLALPYMALCIWISAVIDSPFASMVICKLVIGGVLLAAFIGTKTWEPLIYLKYALPWGLQNRLLHFDLAQVALACAACFGYTAVFLFLGYRHFTRRDL